MRAKGPSSGGRSPPAEVRWTAGAETREALQLIEGFVNKKRLHVMAKTSDGDNEQKGEVGGLFAGGFVAITIFPRVKKSVRNEPFQRVTLSDKFAGVDVAAFRCRETSIG
jgi:hypothetical protein